MTALTTPNKIRVENDLIHDGYFIRVSIPGGAWWLPFTYAAIGIKTHLLHVQTDDKRGWHDRLTDMLELYDNFQDFTVTQFNLGKKSGKFYAVYIITRNTRQISAEAVAAAVMEWWK